MSAYPVPPGRVSGSRKSDLRLAPRPFAPRRREGFWWLASGALAVSAYYLIPYCLPYQDNRELLQHIALFLVGVAIAVLNPRRPWRWSVAALVAFAVADLIHLGGQPQWPEWSYADIWAHLTGGWLTWIGHSALVFCGAFITGLLTHSER